MKFKHGNGLTHSVREYPLRMDTVTDYISKPPTQKCSKCGIEYPLSPQWFHRAKTCKNGFRGDCKSCVFKYQESIREHLLEYGRQYRRTHKTQIREYQNLWRKRNPERKRKYETDKEKRRLWSRKWERENRHRRNARYHVYRARQLKLPNTWTEQNWRDALDYFNGCCAVCGRQLRDLFGTHKPAADHWISLSDKRPDNPGTVPHNIVPLCHGENGCNNKKREMNAKDFLVKFFGKRKAKEILARIEAYFQWVLEQGGKRDEDYHAV